MGRFTLDRLNRLDDKLGMSAGPRGDESRRDYLGRMARRRFLGYADPHVYRELVELHDRVRALESRLAELESRDLGLPTRAVPPR